MNVGLIQTSNLVLVSASQALAVEQHVDQIACLRIPFGSKLQLNKDRNLFSKILLSGPALKKPKGQIFKICRRITHQSNHLNPLLFLFEN